MAGEAEGDGRSQEKGSRFFSSASRVEKEDFGERRMAPIEEVRSSLRVLEGLGAPLVVVATAAARSATAVTCCNGARKDCTCFTCSQPSRRRVRKSLRMTWPFAAAKIKRRLMAS